MGRPAKEPKEKLVEVPCKVSPDVAEVIAQIALSTDRYRGQIARKLIYRGLAAYMRDGNLDEPAEVTTSKKTAPDQSKYPDIPIPTEPLLDIPHERYIGRAYIPSKKKGGKK